MGGQLGFSGSRPGGLPGGCSGAASWVRSNRAGWGQLLTSSLHVPSQPRHQGGRGPGWGSGTGGPRCPHSASGGSYLALGDPGTSWAAAGGPAPGSARSSSSTASLPGPPLPLRAPRMLSAGAPARKESGPGVGQSNWRNCTYAGKTPPDSRWVCEGRLAPVSQGGPSERKWGRGCRAEPCGRLTPSAGLPADHRVGAGDSPRALSGCSRKQCRVRGGWRKGEIPQGAGRGA